MVAVLWQAHLQELDPLWKPTLYKEAAQAPWIALACSQTAAQPSSELQVGSEHCADLRAKLGCVFLSCWLSRMRNCRIPCWYPHSACSSASLINCKVSLVSILTGRKCTSKFKHILFPVSMTSETQCICSTEGPSKAHLPPVALDVRLPPLHPKVAAQLQFMTVGHGSLFAGRLLANLLISACACGGHRWT